MSIIVSIMWVLCAWFAIWRWVDDFGVVRLFGMLVFFLFGPFAAFSALICNPPEFIGKFFQEINPVVWKKS